MSIPPGGGLNLVSPGNNVGSPSSPTRPSGPVIGFNSPRQSGNQSPALTSSRVGTPPAGAGSTGTLAHDLLAKHSGRKWSDTVPGCTGNEPKLILKPSRDGVTPVWVHS